MGNKKTKKNFYVVINGRHPGIYHTWAECDAQVNGHPKAKYQGFESLQEAKEFQNKNSNDQCAAALTQEYQLQGIRNGRQILAMAGYHFS